MAEDSRDEPNLGIDVSTRDGAKEEKTASSFPNVPPYHIIPSNPGQCGETCTLSSMSH